MARSDERGKVLRAGVATLKRSWLQIPFLALAVGQISLPAVSLAQQVRLEGKRRTIVDIRPLYPPLARKVNVRGVVRLRITVSPAGYAVGTDQLGGSPLLVKAAMEAISKAKWEPAPLETKEIVRISFEPEEK